MNQVRILLATSVIALTACTSTTPVAEIASQSAAPPADVLAGQQVYQQFCVA